MILDIIAMIVAFAYIVVVGLLFIWPVILLLIPIIGLLLCGAALTCIELARNKASRTFKRQVLLISIICMIAFLGFTGGVDLLTYGLRFQVFVSGGQDKLHSWAMKILETPRDAEPDQTDSRVYNENWSSQVKFLRPKTVDIKVMGHDTGLMAVYLSYGASFQHWWLVLTPSGVDPDITVSPEYGQSYQWCDGIYVVQEI